MHKLQRNQREYQSQHNQQKPTTYRNTLLTILIIIMIFCIAINLNSLSSVDQNKQFDSLSVIQLANASDIDSKNLLKKIQAEYSLSMYHTPLPNQIKQKLSYGQTRQRQYKIKSVILQKKTKSKQQTCLFTNGISLITKQSIQTARNFLQQRQVYRWIILMSADQPISNQHVTNFSDKMKHDYGNYNFVNKDVIFDSDYKFVTQLTDQCQSIIYIQQNFQITKANAAKFANTSNILRQDKIHGYIGFSMFVQNSQGQTKQLQDLRSVDLSTLPQRLFCKYVYIFDPKLLHIITPLNFINYNRYTLQQMIIYPILALTQKSVNMVPYKFTIHRVQNPFVQFKQFILKRPNKQGKNSFCFVNYPTIPNFNQPEQFKKYVTSISQLEKVQVTLSLVSYFTYNYQINNQSIYESYKSIKQLRDKYPKMRIKLRIKQNKTASSLALYQSAHTYCPDSSIMVSSRTNVEFNSTFLTLILARISQKFHYYFPGRLKSLKFSQLFTVRNQRSYITKNLMLQFNRVQIFKSDLMRMVDLFSLKCDENQFFQTEASFVLPLIQMAGLHVQQLPKVKYHKLNQRKPTMEQVKQMEMLSRYSRWDPINDNILRPNPYNSLTNPSLRRNAYNIIPKNIHQIWLKKQPIPDKTQNMQKTIQQINKDFKYKLWKKQHLNPYTFPLSFQLISRLFLAQQYTDQSYLQWIQAVMSYQILYNQGGIYMDLKVESRKPMDSFLKYQLFFAGFYNTIGDYQPPMSVSRDVIGACRHNYHLKLVLTSMITQNRVNIHLTDYQALVGGDVLRTALTNNQLYTKTYFGLNLFNFDMFKTGRSLCGNSAPCRKYPQAYVIIHN